MSKNAVILDCRLDFIPLSLKCDLFLLPGPLQEVKDFAPEPALLKINLDLSKVPPASVD